MFLVLFAHLFVCISRTGQPPVTCTIVSRRLRLFGHIARADPSQDHSHALRAAINRLPTEWRRRRGQPRRTWLRTIGLTCNRPTLASTRRGFAHKIVPNGVQLWRRLCSPLGVPPDDDDDQQDYSKSSQPISMKLGFMIGPTNWKKWLTFGGDPVPDTDSVV